MDNSFIKLYPTFSEAKYDRMHDSQFYYGSGVCLHPSEKYLQVTNSKVSIAFGESYKVEIIDCSENVLADITNFFYTYSFQDHNGIYQIAFEIMPLNLDFGFENVYFKFTSLSNDATFYTNDFVITEDILTTSIRLDYKDFDIKLYDDFMKKFPKTKYKTTVKTRLKLYRKEKFLKGDKED